MIAIHPPMYKKLKLLLIPHFLLTLGNSLGSSAGSVQTLFQGSRGDMGRKFPLSFYLCTQKRNRRIGESALLCSFMPFGMEINIPHTSRLGLTGVSRSL